MKVLVFVAIFSVVLPPGISAQLWTGSLGDPVLNMTFGYGSNPGDQLPQSQTSLLFASGGCPKPGEYNLLNLTFSCFDNTWHTVSGDHTPTDAGGYYMLVNSESSKADYFVQTVSGLCPNTKYQFGAWIKNVLRPSACNQEGIAPNLTFTVETISGNILNTYNTSNIAASEDPQWKQYGLVFESGSMVNELVLRIKNSAVSGCGNAFALDDITLRACGPIVSAKVASNGLNTIEVCEGNTSFVLTSSYSADYINPVFTWQSLEDGLVWTDISGATSKSYQRPATASGSYTYRMLISEAGARCRIASNEIYLNVRHAPFVQATNYVYGCLGADVTLLASGASQYIWTGPNGFTSTESSPVLSKIQYSNAGLYKVTGTTHIGCVNSDSTFLRVYPNATATSSQGLFVCEGASTRLVAGGGIRYQWEPVTGLSSDTVASPLASPLENTLYTVKVTNQYGCSDETSIKINVWKKPQADAGSDQKTIIGLPVTLNGAAEGSEVSWYWTPAMGGNQSRLLNPIINPPQSTTYTLHVISSHGCGSHTDNVLVKVYDKVVIPNAFSPNGDGINDTWYIDPLEFFKESTTEVYDRFGQLAYRSKGSAIFWDGSSNGRPLPIGTYYYIVNLGIQNQPKLTGSVTLIR
ncbi:MAG: gliding motility-associated C-terminal domain-containing protein [Bacteroidota bacterium]